jgi:hypothetical protein
MIESEMGLSVDMHIWSLLLTTISVFTEAGVDIYLKTGSSVYNVGKQPKEYHHAKCFPYFR